jgi:hypothetical protein
VCRLRWVAEKLKARATLWLVLLAACGGGGGGEPGTPPVAPPNPNLQFNLRGAHAVWLSTGDSRNYTLTGTCQGVVTITVDVATPTTFEGITGWVSIETFTSNFTTPSCTSGSFTRQVSLDSSFTPIGFVQASAFSPTQWAVYTTLPAPLPTLVRIGDAALFTTQTIFTDSTKTTVSGRRELSYVIEFDPGPFPAPQTGIVNFITKTFDTNNQLVSTEQARYQFTQDIRGLKPISIDLQTTAVHFIYTARN